MKDSSCNSSTGKPNNLLFDVGDHLQTLERLNKEIECIKHEVDFEQMRLSHCQTKEAEPHHSLSKRSEKSSCSYGTDRSQTQVRMNKYVIDNSQPRTDLEYDPMSNFSADFGSYKPSGKGQRFKNASGLKRAWTAEDSGATKATQLLSPKMMDSSDDGILVIDVPPSPDEKRSRQQKNDMRQEEAERRGDTNVNVATCSPATTAEAKMTSSSSNNKLQNECMARFEDAVNEALKTLPPVGQTAEPKESNWLNKLLQEEALAYSVNTNIQKEPQSTDSHHFPNKSGLELLSEMSELMQSKGTCQSVLSEKTATVPCSSSSSHQQMINQCEANLDLTSKATVEQMLGKTEVIEICSSSDDYNVNCSDMELSDSDPMEECYRIFMEAHDEEEGKHEPSIVQHAEVQSRTEPKVLAPLTQPDHRALSPGSSKMQQIQHESSMLTTCVSRGPAFLACPSKPEHQTTSFQAVIPMQRPVVNSAEYVSCIPLGSTLVEVGNNVHLILPQGTFHLPVTSSASPVTSVLTPITHVQLKAANFPPATMVAQKHPTRPQVIPPPNLRSALNTRAIPTAATVLPPAPAAKPAAAKRKMKEASKVPSEKVPHDVRQRYVNMFTEEFLKTSANVNDAFEKALAEEKTVYTRSMNKLKYLSIAINALKRLKHQNALPAIDNTESSSQKIKGNISLNLKKVKDDLLLSGDTTLYHSLMDYVLTEDKLIESDFPIQHPEKPGCAILFANSKKTITDSQSLKKICCRCGATYSVSPTGRHVRKEECNYHPGRGVERRVPGGVETRYSCCQGVMGVPGCQLFKLHVHDSLSMEGFVTTVPRNPSDTSCPGVYAVNCEMCYTIHGLELLRVTVVNSSLQVIFDTFVKPDNEIIDYNTRVSGISEEDLKGNCTSLTEVQKTLLNLISADTILIGHGLETDFCALKLFHGRVVDTSVVFPHHLGPPHKLTLNTLTAEYLRKIIQESDCGHDTAEDAAACMALMLWKIKDGKLKN
ncbi:exonuclease GOR-like isoform X1 [Synchiropus splendidus]|uniref:exonuclease GOR-like isoform X1 n=2 Tax=Synchiropus splendidus TaxID=270530 RepID=UPI00237D92B4|nr:exonuclease GOR-like isoform X1 [Synchiropus splendidus]XP_053726995.1 exonuclease GOR-like isoform X1 [Synchiropus splendidus]XP_053726996.1 exonuclease GOR-like isoform X1 [Synchiropus splendidus]XP_053726997.1 exonuclease GOR-like isoform X1 [Synchiropus splendidus]XP_053726998.1 exonuclease GOR-like isoform X1 [Synchiropus splendidus]XP_053726999.1 exonuclease GOR-like isoform X1 [Synchiropus splendidus]XP_053727000.1 exonuclease GOR-like isoform X1 [Synchiropus splendidus]